MCSTLCTYWTVILCLGNKDSSIFTGKINLEILYNVRQQSLTVMVRHVRDLVSITMYTVRTFTVNKGGYGESNVG